MQTMWKLLAEHFPLQAVSPASDLTEYERIRKILSYIEQNYMNRITLTDISENIHLCESECTRLFKRHMNTTLFAFLKEYRIERSLEYLNTKESISNIAEKTGFSDSNYYTKVFSKIKGCSPREIPKKISLKAIKDVIFLSNLVKHFIFLYTEIKRKGMNIYELQQCKTAIREIPGWL